jgi:hypothetical protein
MRTTPDTAAAVTPTEVAAYVADMLAELREMVAVPRLVALHYLISLAYTEARIQQAGGDSDWRPAPFFLAMIQDNTLVEAAPAELLDRVRRA